MEKETKINWVARDVQNKALPDYLDYGRIKAEQFTDISFKDAYDVTSRGDLVAKYDNYVAGKDNQEIHAQNQSASQKWKNGLAKFGLKVGTGVLGGTLGTVNDAWNLYKTGSLDSIMDSEFSTYLDDVNLKIDNNLPNYYTQAEMDMNFFQSLGTANFYANDVLGGASFTVASVLSEAIWAGATGGTSLITSGARIGSRLAVGMSRAKGASKLSIMRSATKGIESAGSLARTARFTMTSAGYESKVETFQFRKEMMETAWKDFEGINNRPPTEEERKEIISNIEEASTALFAMNMAVVGSSNLAVIGKVFNVKSPSLLPKEWVNRNVFGAGVKKGGKAVEATKPQKALRSLYSFGKAPITEGWEEGMQSALSNSAESWTKATYDINSLNNSLGMVEAFLEGAEQTLTSKEGIKEIGIGMIIGALTGSGLSLAKGRLTQDFKQIDEQAKRTEDYYNLYSPNQVASMLAFSGRVQESERSLEEAQKLGDFNGEEQARASTMLAQIAYAHSLGDTDTVIQEVGISLDSLGVEEIMEEYGVSSEEASQIKEQLKTQYRTLSSEYAKNKDFADSFFDDDSSREKLERRDLELVREAVAYELTLGVNTYEFNRDILESIKREVAGEQEVGAEIDNILRSSLGKSRKKFVEARKRLQDSVSYLEALEQEAKNVEQVIEETPEATKLRLDKLNQHTKDIAKAREDILKYESEAKMALNAARLSNPYNKSDLETVSTEEILQSQKFSDNIRERLESLSQSDPVKASRLQKLLDEYQRSSHSFERYKTLLTQMSKPDLGLKGKGSIVKRVFGDNKISDTTTEFLNGLKGTVENIREAELAQNLLASDENLRELRDRRLPTDSVKVAKPKEDEALTIYQRIIENNPYLRSKGEETRVPTEEDIREYLELGNKASEEVKEVISNWEHYGQATEDGTSLADILKQEQQHTEKPKDPAESALNPERIGEIFRDGNREGETGARREDLAQVYEGVQVKRDKQGDRIFGISLKGLLESLGVSDVISLEKGSKVVKFSRDVQGKVGEVASFGDDIVVEVLPGRVLKVTNYDNLPNVKDFKYAYSKGSGYSFLYGNDGKPLTSDFNEVEYAPNEVYSLEEGQEIGFLVDASDPYNLDIMRDDNMSDEDRENNVKIYIVDSQGNILGDFKANREVKGHPNFSLLRKNAYSLLKRGGGQIKGSGTVSDVLLGTPNIEVDEQGNPIMKDLDMTNVVDFGKSKDGKLSLNNKTENVRNTFVKKGNFDVAVVRVGNQLVALPIEIESSENLYEEVMSILDSSESLAKKAISLNSLALENGIEGVLDYRSSEENNLFEENGEPTELFSDFYDRLIAVNKPFKVETLEDLDGRAKTIVDTSNRPLVAPKIRIDMETVVSSNVADPNTSKKVLSYSVAKEVANILKGQDLGDFLDASSRLNVAQDNNDGTRFRKKALEEARKEFNEEATKLSKKLKVSKTQVEKLNKAISKAKLSSKDLEAISKGEVTKALEASTKLSTELLRQVSIIQKTDC